MLGNRTGMQVCMHVCSTFEKKGCQLAFKTLESPECSPNMVLKIKSHRQEWTGPCKNRPAKLARKLYAEAAVKEEFSELVKSGIFAALLNLEACLTHKACVVASGLQHTARVHLPPC